MGMHEKFGELLDDFKLSPKLIPILKEQVRLVLEDSLKSFEGKRKDLLSQITQKENELEKCFAELKGIFLARDLINLPPNILTPYNYEKIIKNC